MTETDDPSTELAELKAQRAAAKNGYKEQKKGLKAQIRALKQSTRRIRKIAKLENRLDGLKQATTAE